MEKGTLRTDDVQIRQLGSFSVDIRMLFVFIVGAIESPWDDHSIVCSIFSITCVKRRLRQQVENVFGSRAADTSRTRGLCRFDRIFVTAWATRNINKY